MSPLSGSVAVIVMISTPLALFSAISPLYEESVKLGASFTLFTVIVTLAVVVFPTTEGKKFGNKFLSEPHVQNV